MAQTVYNKLEKLIRKHIDLGNVTGSGFNPVICQVCNDHGRKGARAGFSFNEGAITYRCFNCGMSAKYVEGKSRGISRKMRNILTSFDVPESDVKALSLHMIRNEPINVRVLAEERKLEPHQLSLPSHFYKLDVSDKGKETQEALKYLRSRNISPEEYTFYLSSGKRIGVDLEPIKWKSRLIIPIYKDKRIIFYIGRDMSGQSNRKYLTPDAADKRRVLYGFDEILDNKNKTKPLFVVEGFFDAFCISGVALLGNSLSKEQEEWLNRTPRPKIVIPDKYSSGDMLARQAINLGWSLSLPNFDDDIKDISDAIGKYGKLFTMKRILDSVHRGFSAEVRMRTWFVNKKA